MRVRRLTAKARWDNILSRLQYHLLASSGSLRERKASNKGRGGESGSLRGRLLVKQASRSRGWRASVGNSQCLRAAGHESFSSKVD